jgi:hypothetical protein
MDSISMQSNSTPVLQEEIAGPAPAFAPIQRQQRFASMDVLQGIALLGILIANVSDFGLPGWDYLVPLSTSKPVFTGPHAAANTAIWGHLNKRKFMYPKNGRRRFRAFDEPHKSHKS